MILILVALIFVALFYTTEEKIFQIYNLDPLQAVGLEGAFGIIF